MERTSFMQRLISRGTALLVFIIVLGLGFVFSEFIKIPITFTFTITETGDGAIFSTRIGEILEIITWSFGLPVTGYFLLNVNVQKWKRHDLIPVKKEKTLSNVFVLAVILISCGNIVHVLFNQYNSRVEDFALVNQDAWNLFVLVYFIDEHVSHAMVHAGILLTIGAILAAEPVENLPGEATATKKNATMLAMLLGLVMGPIQAFSSLEGQCAFIILVVSWLMVVIVLAVHFKRGNRGFKTLRPLERLNLAFFVCTVIATTIVVVAWGSIFGLWPSYPFFKQPGEVFP